MSGSIKRTSSESSEATDIVTPLGLSGGSDKGKIKLSLPEFHLFGLSLLHHHCQVSRKHFNFDVRMRILVTITKGAKELHLAIFLGFTVTTLRGFCLVK